MFSTGIKLESAYLKGRMHFGYNAKIDLSEKNKPQDLKDSLILKNMELVLGSVAAHAILNHVSKTVGKSRLDILSNFETFSNTIKQVYGEVEGKKFLSRLPVTQ